MENHKFLSRRDFLRSASLVSIVSQIPESLWGLVNENKENFNDAESVVARLEEISRRPELTVNIDRVDKPYYDVDKLEEWRKCQIELFNIRIPVPANAIDG